MSPGCRTNNHCPDLFFAYCDRVRTNRSDIERTPVFPRLPNFPYLGAVLGRKHRWKTFLWAVYSSSIKVCQCHWVNRFVRRSEGAGKLNLDPDLTCLFRCCTTSPMKLSFSLNKPKTSGPPPSLSRSSAFDDGHDDDKNDTPSTLPSSDGKTSVNKVTLAQNVRASKATKKKIEVEKQTDPTVYEYDEVWDKMQDAKLRAKAAKDQESKARKVRVRGLLNPSARY